MILINSWSSFITLRSHFIFLCSSRTFWRDVTFSFIWNFTWTDNLSWSICQALNSFISKQSNLLVFHLSLISIDVWLHWFWITKHTKIRRAFLVICVSPFDFFLSLMRFSTSFAVINLLRLHLRNFED